MKWSSAALLVLVGCGGSSPPPAPPAPPASTGPIEETRIAVTREEHGDLSREDIDGVIKSHKASLRACYHDALAQTPGLSGKIVVEFAIGRDGSVSESRVASTSMYDARVEGCLVGLFAAMEFPPKGPANVKYPLIFTPG